MAAAREGPCLAQKTDLLPAGRIFEDISLGEPRLSLG